MGQDTRDRVYVKNSTGGELIDHHQELKQKEQTDEKQSASKDACVNCMHLIYEFLLFI